MKSRVAATVGVEISIMQGKAKESTPIDLQVQLDHKGQRFQ